MKKIILFCLSVGLVLLFIGCPPAEEEKVRQKNTWETNSIPADFSLNHNFWDNASVYFVITDRFYNGNPNNDTSYGREKGDPTKGTADCGKFFGGDIAGLTAKLDYLKDLGINAIWLTAPYEQIHGWCVGAGNTFKHYPYHGYYALDYTNMDANMGTKAEFKTFVDTAHQKGIRVIMDVVMNHPGYATLEDLANLVPGVLKRTDIDKATLSNYHDDYIDYSKGQHGWDSWWSPSWVRAGLCSHYGAGDGSTIKGCQASLPDFITEGKDAVSIAPILAAKHSAAMSEKYPSEGYSVVSCQSNDNFRVRDYLIYWLSSWVREFGIDGFRCDTAKHVEMEAWYQLKVACVQALRDWKSTNADKKIDNSDFWMTGECFTHGVEKDAYYTKGGFDSMINFYFRNAAYKGLTDITKIEDAYADYASKINSDDSFNVLTYISSHDTGDQDSRGLFYSDYANTDEDQMLVGSYLAFCPGAIQIFYGDECGRLNSNVSTGSDKSQKTRSQMPWAEGTDGYITGLNSLFEPEIYAHWSKVLNFRKSHFAVGAGTHSKIADTPYTFSRVKDDDKVVIVLGAVAGSEIQVDVSSIGAASVKDAYTGTIVAVTNSKATFTVGNAGVVLIEKSNN